jgi:hypothetical protein
MGSIITLLMLLSVGEIHQPCPPNIGTIGNGNGPGETAAVVEKWIPPNERATYDNTGRSSEAILRFVISPAGKPCDIEFLTLDYPPAGPGILEALEQWRFKPARKDGKPIAVWSIVNVNVARGDRASKPEPSPHEEQFNRAVAAMSSTDPAKRKAAIGNLAKLSTRHYPPAIAFVALATYRGELDFPKDPASAKQLIHRALPTNSPAILYAHAVILLAEQQREEAIHYLKLAAKRNYIAAQKQLVALGVE